VARQFSTGTPVRLWRKIRKRKRKGSKTRPHFYPPLDGLSETSLLAGGKKTERGEKRIYGASQGWSATARDVVTRFFSRKILVAFHSPRKIVCPAESILLVLIIWILLEIVSNFVQQTPQSFLLREKLCGGEQMNYFICK